MENPQSSFYFVRELYISSSCSKHIVKAISDQGFKVTFGMSQTNKSSDSQQEDQHQLNFISPIVNSDDKTGGKENSNAGDSCKEPAENLAINAKEAKSSPQRER